MKDLPQWPDLDTGSLTVGEPVELIVKLRQSGNTDTMLSSCTAFTAQPSTSGTTSGMCAQIYEIGTTLNIQMLRVEKRERIIPHYGI